MKRGIAAIIILTFCITFALIITFMLELKTQAIIDLAQSAANDKNNVYILEKEWNKKVIYFELFADHSYFEGIDKKIRNLKYLEGETYTNTCTETVTDLVKLKEYLKFSLPNVF